MSRLTIIAGLVMGSIVASGLDSRLGAQVSLTEVGLGRGLGPASPCYGMATGAACADFDDDGDIDIFFPTIGGQLDRLYVNQGGTFVNEAVSRGITDTGPHRSALWLDVDGDGDLDLLVVGDCWQIACPGGRTACLYLNEGGTFTDVGWASGFLDAEVTSLEPHRTGITASDLDLDGDLDVIMLTWNGFPRLYYNQGDGTFVRRDDEAGFPVDDSDFYWQSVAHDFDHDGWPDIYVSVDFGPNQLWLNQRDGTFLDAAPAVGADNSMNDMGIAIGDPENDGDFDLYVTNIFQMGRHNVYLRNDSTPGTLLFTERSQQLGIDNGFWGWGASFLDIDNDGWLDLAATNGFESLPWLADPSVFFYNLGSGAAFEDRAGPFGFQDIEYGSSLSALDYDRDGDLDLVQTNFTADRLRLLENEIDAGLPANYLVVRPRMANGNTHAVGAVVRALVGTETLSRLITAGTSMMGQEPYEAHFGLSDATEVTTLTLDWPDGSRTTLESVVANQVLDVVHGGFGDLNADGTVDLEDVDRFIESYSAPLPLGIPERAADLNRNGQVDCDDWGRFRSHYLAATGSEPAPTGSVALECGAFQRGDANGDGDLDLGDGVQTLEFLFLGASLPCRDAADFDDSGRVDVADAVRTFDFLLTGQAPPPAPWPSCGYDASRESSPPLPCGVSLCP